MALSFVREAKDIELAKKYIKDYGGNIPVIAKIEKPQAVENLEEILKVTDGIMVARGDLGIEMSPEEVPIVQKYIVDQTIRERKVCIVATQMLESMIENPIPTRAEASDVANAILDGTDAIMLSGETAMGKHPVEAVKMMRKIATNVEDCNFCLSNLDLEMNDKYDLSPTGYIKCSCQDGTRFKCKSNTCVHSHRLYSEITIKIKAYCSCYCHI